MTRTQHLQWAKDRAKNSNAQSGFQLWVDFRHDMGKHDETKDHIALELGNMMFLQSLKNMPSYYDVDEFIEGFN